MAVTIYKLVNDETVGIDLYKTYGNLTVSKIIKERPPSLAYYKREAQNVDELRKTIARYLLTLCDWFESNVKNMHVIEISEKILSSQHLNHLTFEDLYIMGEEFKTKKSFGKMTPAVLLRSISEYAKYKLDQVVAYNKEQHLKTKDDPGLSARIRSRGKTGHNPMTVINKVNERRKWNQKN